MKLDLKESGAAIYEIEQLLNRNLTAHEIVLAIDLLEFHQTKVIDVAQIIEES